jgi:sugar O-acyltransferase (sialic acid O-acetyltransferase NeuD family)
MPVLRILGGGGHAKVVIATARSAGYAELAVHDDAPGAASVLGVPVVGPLQAVLADPDALAVFAIGNNATRHRLARGARCQFATLVHRDAIVEPSASLGPGTVVFAGAVVQPEVRIGAHGIVNTAATIDHDCVLGDAVHLGPGVRLAGNVRIDDGAFLGIGVVAIPGRHVGAWTTVGYG